MSLPAAKKDLKMQLIDRDASYTTFIGDALRLQQILFNLACNADELPLPVPLSRY